MYVIGLSGGIGSGKTVASDHFERLGATVVDTDIIARQIVQPNTPTLAALVECFGSRILVSTGTNSGELDRARLRDIAFSSPENKAQLDAITHPAIRDETLSQVQNCQTPYCIVVVPLLGPDSPFRSLMQRILIVTADTDVKIQRVMQRSGLSHDDVVRIMKTQLSDSERLRFADDVIANNAGLQHVYDQVEQLHDDYSQRSRMQSI